MRRVLALFALLVVAVSAWATECLEYSTRTQYSAELTATGTQYGWSTSKAAACANSEIEHIAALAAQGYGYISGHYIAGDACYVTTTNPQTHLCGETCTTVVYSGGFTSRMGECQPGSLCQSPSGTSTTGNITMGYQGSPPTPGGTGILDYLPNGQPNSGGVPSVPSTMCFQNCVMTMGTGGDIWASMQPTNAGMYRMSQDWSMTSTGTECTATADEKNLTDGSLSAPAVCPGFQGYVDGRPACIPKVPTPATAKPAAGNTTGNPTAGSASGAADRIPWVGGDGGNKGGPPHPKDGTKTSSGGVVITPSATIPGSGTKSAVAGEEQVACGAPGQPPCKIDEAGTPVSKDLKLDEAAINAAATSNRGVISGTGDKGMFSSWTAVFVTPPVVACEPTAFTMIEGYTVDADPCPVVEGTRSVVGWLWALSGFWVCLGWIREAV